MLSTQKRVLKAQQKDYSPTDTYRPRQKDPDRPERSQLLLQAFLHPLYLVCWWSS